MTLKMVDQKIQTANLMRVKTIQYDAIGGVLDCFYTSEEAWIFNPPFLKPLDTRMFNLINVLFFQFLSGLSEEIDCNEFNQYTIKWT